MDIPGEDELIGINVHFCATCDGAFYKGKKVLVVGGGNSGFEEGLFLTKFATQVDIIVNSPEPKASKILQEKVAEQENMSVLLNHNIKELRGKNKLESVLVEDKNTNENKVLNYDGVFVFIGLTPNNDLLKETAKLDQWGFIKTEQHDDEHSRHLRGRRRSCWGHKTGCCSCGRGRIRRAGNTRISQVHWRIN